MEYTMIRRFAWIAPVVVGLLAPATVAADVVYFVSKTTGGLYSFDTSGGGITTLSGAGTFSSPSALAMGSDGNLYIGDATGSGRIAKYVMTSGSVSSIVMLSGTDPSFGSGPVSPASIAFTPAGAMLVGRNPENAFAGFPAGQVLEIVGWNSGTPTVQNYTSGTTLNYQTGLAVAPDGTLYATNTVYDIFASPNPALVGDVLKFDGSGLYQSVTAVDGSGTGGLFGPTGLAVSGDSLYVASAMNGNVYKTDLTNPDTATNTSLFGSANGDYVGPLSLLSDGSLLAGSVSGPAGLIYQFDSSGDLINAFGAPAYGQIGGIVAVPEPSAFVLAAAGVTGFAVWRVRRSRRKG
jgi:sugar lactone lactonase YvrE